MEVTGQFLPGIVFLSQTSGLPAALGQLGLAAAHQGDERPGHALDRDLALPPAPLAQAAWARS
jgi:hypothetical protein